MPSLIRPMIVGTAVQRAVAALTRMPDYLGPVGSPLRPPKLYNTLYVWACADVLTGASISHSGATASIKPTSVKEAVCFLFVT
jgi:hypothetical protein